jgi:hypothetical protein
MSTHRFWRGAWVAVSGACIGFLAGLSVSPVAGVLLSGIGALAGGMTSTLAGLGIEALPDNQTDRPNAPDIRIANPIPVSLLLLGMVLGTVLGVWVRTHDYLGAPQGGRTTDGGNLSSGKNGTGRSGGTEEGGSPTLTQTKSTNGIEEAQRGVLYTDKISECSEWRTIPNVQALRENLSQSKTVRSRPGFSQIVKGCGDSDCLHGVVESLCTK